MSEERMVELAQEALRARGVEDEVIAAGEFNPRGHTGGLFAGGLAGGEAGGALGRVGEDVGLAAGSLAGMRAVDAASGLPGWMVVAVTAANVYGFEGRRSKVGELVFEAPRAGLTAQIHKRVNVRVLELVDETSGSTIELEGNRLPVTHSKDVIDLLS
jgi:hypothetical protein